MVNNSYFHKGETASKTIIDPIRFNSKEDAELYIKEAMYPICQPVHSNIKDRWYINLKDSQIIKEITGNDTEYLIDPKTEKTVFGVYGTCDYDKNTLKDFLDYIRIKHKYSFKTSSIIEDSYNIKEIGNIKENDEIKNEIFKLSNNRNTIIINEIKRTEKYLKMLKSLIK